MLFRGSKITAAKGSCPVFVTVCLFILAVPGCGDGRPRDEIPEDRRGPVLSEAVSVEGFVIVPIPGDTVWIAWTGEGPGTVESLRVSEGDTVRAGDTLALVIPDMSTMLAERLKMEIEMAVMVMNAGSQSDSAAAWQVDSLGGLLDSLTTNAFRPVRTEVTGEIVGMGIEAGDSVLPGKGMFAVKVDAAGSFLVTPPDGVEIFRWPGCDDTFPVEEKPGAAVYSGDSEEIGKLLEGMIAVGRTAVFERDLDCFLITSGRDTITVERMGKTREGMVVVLPDRDPGRELVTWTSVE